MFFQHADNRAIRTRERTLVEVDGGGWELYETTRDPLETADLAPARPAEVRQLADAWSQWWNRQNQGRPCHPESTANSPHYSPEATAPPGKPADPQKCPPKPENP